MMNLPPLSSPVSWLVDTSVRASVVIVLLLCARPWLRRFAGSRVVAFLWLLVAAWLLLPWPVSRRWSLPAPWSVTGAVAAAPAVPRPAALSVRASVSPASHARHGVATPGPPSAPDAWSVLWLGGVLLAAARLARGWWQTRNWRGFAVSGEDGARLARVFDAIPSALRRGVGLRLTDAVEIPALAGVFRPCIWLPRGWLGLLDDEGLRHVLLHELGHARRRDLLAQWFCALACCVHWFNPLAWLLARAARADRELACDAWVLARGDATDPGGSFPSAYGHTLIRAAARLGARPARPPLAGAVTMAAGKHQLGLRVREIGAFRPTLPWRGWAAGGGVLAASLAVATLGGADPAPPQPVPAPKATPGQIAPGIYQADSARDLLEKPATAPAPAAAPSGKRPEERTPGIEIESKFIELSSQAVRELQRTLAHGTDRTKGLADQLASIVAGSATPAPRDDANAANFSVSQVISRQEMQDLVHAFNQQKGVDLLSAPRVTTKSGQKATVEIIRDFVYPIAFDRATGADGQPKATPSKFDKKSTGVTLEVEPSLAPARDVVDLNLSSRLVALEGWVRARDGKPFPPDQPDRSDARPVFVTQQVDTFMTMPPDGTLVLGGLRRHPGTSFTVAATDSPATPEERIVLTFISLKLVGLPVKGRPGYVQNPYAPDSGPVDVRGVGPGSEVSDPFTGKHFVVP